MAWQIGQKLQGRYTLESVLGRGGFGITYLAWDNDHADRRVIKVLNDEVQQDLEFEKLQQNFLNEALCLAKCSHPHVVKVEEIIQQDDRWGIVMDYVQGETLAHRIQLQGRIPVGQALNYTRQIGSALSFVHEKELLHRDVKPANIILRQDRDEAVLIDFGLARSFYPDTIQRHTSYGTDGYAPLEQYDSWRKRSAAIDVYALAATTYSMLTGSVPVCAPARATGRPLDPPQSLNPEISERMSQAILQGMALKPDERPQSVAQWMELLDPIPVSVSMTDKPVAAPPVADKILVAPVVSITTGDLNELAAILAARTHNTTPPIPVAIASIQLSPDPPTLKNPYDPLKALLMAGRWQEADQETTRLMLRIRNRQVGQLFEVKDIQNFPCLELRTIDQLWFQYSQGRFGFRVQKQIWQQVNKKSESFADQVGWRIRGEWLSYSQLSYSLEASKGHLPIGFLAGFTGGIKAALLVLDRVVIAKITDCHYV